MNATDTPRNANPPPLSADSDAIPLYDRLVLWMFLIGLLVFALIIVADLVDGLSR